MNGTYDVIIIGTGPAGTSTALHLYQRDPAWAGRVLLIDKAVHPREKLCGGGVTHYGEDLLTDLGLKFEPRHFDVREVRLDYEGESYSFRGSPVFRITHRAEFDHWLLGEVRKHGFTIREGEGVTAIHIADDDNAAVDAAAPVTVTTERGKYRGKVLIAADGSKSTVRRLLAWPEREAPHLSRLVETLTDEDERQAEFADGRAILDFSRMTDRLQGYYWDFPSYVDGRPRMNRGLFDSRIQAQRPRADLKGNLNDFLSQRERKLDEGGLKGHPIRCFDPRSTFARPHVILAGDAAGADPLFGEGISFALAYGKIAAEAVAAAFDRNDFTFGDYRRRILRQPLMRQLKLRVRLARMAYVLHRPWFVRMMWRIAGAVVRWTPWSKESFRPAKRVG